MDEDWGIRNLRLVASCLWLSGSVVATSFFLTWGIGGRITGPVILLGTIAVAILLCAAVVQTEIRPRVFELQQRRAKAEDA